MEMLRRRSEKNIRTYNAREKMQEGEEQAKVRFRYTSFSITSTSYGILIIIVLTTALFHSITLLFTDTSNLLSQQE
jgi:hypothetical protein